MLRLPRPSLSNEHPSQALAARHGSKGPMELAKERLDLYIAVQGPAATRSCSGCLVADTQLVSQPKYRPNTHVLGVVLVYGLSADLQARLRPCLRQKTARRRHSQARTTHHSRSPAQRSRRPRRARCGRRQQLPRPPHPGSEHAAPVQRRPDSNKFTQKICDQRCMSVGTMKRAGIPDHEVLCKVYLLKSVVATPDTVDEAGRAEVTPLQKGS